MTPVLHLQNAIESRKSAATRVARQEANFLGEPRGGLCPSDCDPPEL